MRTLGLTPVMALLFSLTLPLSAPADPAGGWRLLTARDGILVFRQYSRQTQLETFRGVMRMKLPDEYAMLALYNDVEAFPRWLHMINGASELGRNNPLDRLLRFQINLLWPVKDREAIVNTTLVQVTTEEEESVTAFMESRPRRAPPNDDFVRIPELDGIFRLERVAPETVEVTFQVSLDMGGWIPDWMVNLALRNMPFHTLRNLREVVREPQYQGQYYSYLDLFGPGRPEHLPPAKSWVYGTVNEAGELKAAKAPTKEEPVAATTGGPLPDSGNAD